VKAIVVDFEKHTIVAMLQILLI